MERNPRMGIDRLTRLLASRAQPLHRPSQHRCVHGSDIACLPRLHYPRRTRLVKAGHILKDRDIPALRFNHLHKNAQR